jgi:hypothetical protein
MANEVIGGQQLGASFVKLLNVVGVLIFVESPFEALRCGRKLAGSVDHKFSIGGNSGLVYSVWKSYTPHLPTTGHILKDEVLR